MKIKIKIPHVLLLVNFGKHFYYVIQKLLLDVLTKGSYIVLSKHLKNIL